MKVVEFLKKAAARSGFIKILTADQAPCSGRIRTKQVLLKDLMEEFHNMGRIHQIETAPELSVDFDRIFDAAKIGIFGHGWSVDKVMSFLESETNKGLRHEDARRVLVEELSKNRVPLEDIVKDAIARDQALDSYEKYAYKKLQERISARREEIAMLERQIQEYQENIHSLESLQGKDQEAFRQWVQRKVAKEEELLRVASLITEDPGVSTGSVTEKKAE